MSRVRAYALALDVAAARPASRGQHRHRPELRLGVTPAGDVQRLASRAGAHEVKPIGSVAN